MGNRQCNLQVCAPWTITLFLRNFTTGTDLRPNSSLFATAASEVGQVSVQSNSVDRFGNHSNTLSFQHITRLPAWCKANLAIHLQTSHQAQSNSPKIFPLPTGVSRRTDRRQGLGFTRNLHRCLRESPWRRAGRRRPRGRDPGPAALAVAAAAAPGAILPAPAARPQGQRHDLLFQKPEDLPSQERSSRQRWCD